MYKNVCNHASVCMVDNQFNTNLFQVISKDGRASPEQNCSAYDLTVKNADVASGRTQSLHLFFFLPFEI